MTGAWRAALVCLAVVGGIALLTDTDNTGETAETSYGDIELAPR